MEKFVKTRRLTTGFVPLAMPEALSRYGREHPGALRAPQQPAAAAPDVVATGGQAGIPPAPPAAGGSGGSGSSGNLPPASGLAAFGSISLS